MIPVLVLSHGEFAREILSAARIIDPQLEVGAEVLTLPWDIKTEEAGRLLASALKRLDQGEGVLVLTDMFGGTATNISLPFLEPGKVEVVTGVNLPMLLKLGSLRTRKVPLHEMALGLMEAGQKSIRVASEFLKSRSSRKGGG